MKVVEIVRGLGMGGAETLLYSRLRYAIRTSEVTAESVTIVNTHSPESYYSGKIRQLGVDVRDLATGSRWVSAYRLWRLLPGLTTEDTTFIVHSPWPAAVLKLRLAMGWKSRVVEVAHSTRYAAPTLVLGWLLNRFADACLAVSSDVACAPTTKGFAWTQVILAGADRQRIRAWVALNNEAPRVFRASLGLAADVRVVVAVGSLLPLKGHRDLIEAVAGMGDDIHLVIVGEGPCRNDLLAEAVNFGCAERVHLVGLQPDAWRWTAVGDVMAHPSHYEGLPIALVEARTLGVPIVASDVGGVAAVLAGDARSYLVAPGDPNGLRDRLNQALDAAAPKVEVFGSLADDTSYWEMGRYCSEFYDFVESDLR